MPSASTKPAELPAVPMMGDMEGFSFASFTAKAPVADEAPLINRGIFSSVRSHGDGNPRLRKSPTAAVKAVYKSAIEMFQRNAVLFLGRCRTNLLEEP
jgi:hypothetical protein